MSMLARKYFQDRRSRLESVRQSWESRLRELCQYILPEYDRFFTDGRENKDDANWDGIINPRATLASEILAAGLFTGITNPTRQWFRLSHPDRKLADSPAVKRWLEECTKLMLGAFGRSNLYNTLPQVYQEMAVFGTSCLFCGNDKKDVLRFWNISPGEYFIDMDERGVCNTLYRDISLTVGQVVAMFGLENCSQTVKDLWAKPNYNEIVRVTQAIEPNRIPLDGVQNKLPKGCPFIEVYFERAAKPTDETGLLKVKHYYEFPAFAPRWHVVSTNIYGVGRGHKALGDIKELQHEMRVHARALEKMVDPPIKAPSGTDDIDLEPGGKTLYDASAGPQAFSSVYNINLDLDRLSNHINELEQSIDRTFYADAFQMMALMEGRAQITAREIDERREEKLLRLGSVLLRLNDELLDPLVIRAFEVMMREGILPEAPDAIRQQGQSLRIEYDSVLSQVQKAQGVASTERFLGTVGNISAMQGGNPAAWDMVDVDEVIRDYGESVGVSGRYIRKKSDIEASRKQRQALQEAQQASAISGEAAKTARDLAASPTDSENALTGVLAGMRAGV